MYSKLLTLSFLFLQFISFGQWEQKANPLFTKDHGIGFSLDGMGYVLTGGANGQVFSTTKDFFKYDPTTDTWTQLPDYPGPNRGYGIGDTYDGKLYFGFGTDDFALLNDLWSWDPVTNVFTELPSCPCQGRVHPAFVAVDGKVFVGTGGASGNLNDWWEYDITSQIWTQKTNIPQTRHHPYQFVIDGDVYVGNGHRNTWYKYKPSVNSWTAIATLGTRVAGAQFSYNGKGYALSGADNNHNSFNTGEFWEYDPIDDSWTALPAHPGTSRFAPTQFVIDGYAYILGGYYRFNNSVTAETTMWRYDLNQVPVGISETDIQYLNRIYPNPANNEINLQLAEKPSENTIVNIYNLSGQLALSVPFSNSIDIANLESGLYIFDVVDENGSIMRQKVTKL